jgi:hypothetical protein
VVPARLRKSTLIRLVVWNCNMRLHDKVEALRDLRPDLAVLPECACPEVLLRRSPEIGAADFAWTGPNPAKGLAVLAFGPWRLTPRAGHDPRAATALPLHVSGPVRFRLLALWALPTWAHRQWERPPEAVTKVVERSGAFLKGGGIAVAGDFHQALLRRRRGALAPSPFARKLSTLGLESAYHRARGESHGAEREATYYPYRRRSLGHHADHVFLDPRLMRALRSVEIGTSHWLSVSDHVPVLTILAEDELR